MITSYHTSFAQSYNQLMDLAQSQIKAEEYQQALATFETAFKEKHDEIGKYDYANAMVVAIKCNEIGLALEWFQEGYDLNLGDSDEEISYFRTDPIFNSVRDEEAYCAIFKKMEKRNESKKQRKIDEDNRWRLQIRKNRVQKKHGSFKDAPHGFALYFSYYNEEKVPYLVYVPKTYNTNLLNRTIVFLHGGVVANDEFLPFDSWIRQEPIFAIADSLKAIVVYPFAKKSFGWIDHKDAFDNIFHILDDAHKRYAIDINHVYLGGVSDGGNATFWFANQNETPFRAFFTFSARPKLPNFELPGEPMKFVHPVYSLHAEDDSTYLYNEVKKIYRNLGENSKWHMQTIKKGGHGFIYQPGSLKMMLKFFRNVFQNEDS